MGTLLSPHKLEFTRQDLQPFYSEVQSPQFFNFCRSNGFRNSQPAPEPTTDITQFLDKENDKEAKKNKLKLVRKRIVDTSIYPYSCIGLLVVTFNKKVVYGTGSLISKNIILTAASTVYDKENNAPANQVRFILNMKENMGDVYIVHNIHFHSKYIEQAEGSHRYNYAILEIKEKQEKSQQNQKQQIQTPKGVNSVKNYPGLIFGYLGFYTKFIGSQLIYIFGYSKQESQKGTTVYSMRSEKTDKLICKHSALGYTMESVPSEIGSPILIRRGQYYQLVGIHINSKKELSSGLQFDQSVRQYINKRVKQPEGQMNLTECSLVKQQVQAIALMDWHNMTIINLNKNNLKCVGFRKITQKPWPMLRELFLSDNGIYRLQFDPSNIKNLQKLNLSKNNIKDITILSELPYLRFLDLSYNKIESMQELLVLKYMQRLDLSFNRMSKIPNQIEMLGELKKLYLTKNDIESLPLQILKLKELIVLAVDKNKSKFFENEIVLRLQQQNVEVILQ